MLEIPVDIVQVQKSLEKDGIRVIRLMYSDLHGIARGKDILLDNIAHLINEGSPFCTTGLISGLASETILSPGFAFDLGYPDMRAKLLPATLRRVPWESGTVWGLADLEDEQGPLELSPRNLLKRVVEQYHQKGLNPVVGPEIEFFLLKMGEGSQINRYVDKYSREYTVGQRSDPQGIIREMLITAQAMQLFGSAAYHEYCRGQFELNISHSEALDAADRAFLLKVMIKDIAARHDLLATFMGKPLNDDAGSGLHLHVSVYDERGENVFAASETQMKELSLIGQHFIAGLLKHSSSLMAFFAPTINAYKRIGSNSLASINANWAYDNRTSFIRIPAEYGANTRIEIRAPDASANPYLVIAASLLAGLDGIENRLVPLSPLRGNGIQNNSGKRLPFTLEASLEHFRKNEYFREQMGHTLIDAFCALKEAEIERFHRYVTDWEVREYMWHL